MASPISCASSTPYPDYSATCPPPIPSACKKTADFRVQISYLNERIGNFIYRCDNVLSELRSARDTELLDTVTSNTTTLAGYFISNLSYTKNHDAARQVDALQREAARINSAVRMSGLPISQYLNTYVNGNRIRAAENAEHSFFYDWFTSGVYSSIGSANTVTQIQSTIEQVEQLRWQACSLQSAISRCAFIPTECF